jgi:formiminotetrahydrofolate cyclodeaminase
MSEPLDAHTVGAFLDALASSSPTPGGGSVAALSGAMAAGLVSLVSSLTVERQHPEDDEELNGLRERAERLRGQLQQLAQEDIAVFGRLAAAYKLPRTTEADAASRQAAIQQVTRIAAEVPLRIAQAAAEVLPLCTALAPRVGRLIVSEVGIATVLARATVQSAILDVEINLAGLEDQRYVRETRARIEDLIVGLSEEAEGVLTIVRRRINQ